jgi:hypothetical protein
MSSVNAKLLAELNTKDDLVFKLGDTLDVKLSIVLVVITVVGAQTAYFFTKPVVGIQHTLQVCSVVFLVLATIAAIAGLWPRHYWMIEPEGLVENRIKELEAYYKENGEEVERHLPQQLELDQIGWAKTRIADNRSINNRKAWRLDAAFYATSCAIACNILTLIWFIHPF